MFTDREIIHKEESPDSAWTLYIYGPSSAEQSPLESENAPFYASFRKKSSQAITAVPFGYPTNPSGIRVNWNEDAKKICHVNIGDDCYVLFLYGVRKDRERERFRVSPQPPFSVSEIKSMTEKGYLEES